jgi:hypothetical protein
VRHKGADQESEASTEEWQPTDEQKAALTHACILLHRCEALGIEWDPRS